MGCIEHALNDDRRLCSVVLSLIGVANQKLGDCHRHRGADPRELAPLNQPRMTLPLRLALSQPPAPESAVQPHQLALATRPAEFPDGCRWGPCVRRTPADGF